MSKYNLLFLSPIVFRLQSKKKESIPTDKRFKNSKGYKSYFENLLLSGLNHMDKNSTLVIFSNFLGKKAIIETVKNLNNMELKAEYSYAYKTKDLKSEWEANLSNWALIFNEAQEELSLPKGWAYLDEDFKGEPWPSSSLLPLVKGLNGHHSKLLSLGHVSKKLKISCDKLKIDLEILPFT